MIPEVLSDIVNDYTIRNITLGAMVLGIVSGSLGTFAVLRRQSLLGDSISHAVLPGIILAFMLTGSRDPLILIIGAAVVGWIATLSIMTIVNTTRIKADASLALVLSVFFGFGMVLMTFVQRQPEAAAAGLSRFLFGQAAAIIWDDVRAMLLIGGAALVVLLIFWKEFKLVVFDRSFALSLGMPVRRFDILLTSLLVIAIVIGLQTVGVVLMSAMVVAPAAAARQWTDRLGLVTALAGGFGALAGVSGALISAYAARMPTGPTIVLCLTVIVVGSLILAPNRGVLWSWVRQHRQSRELRSRIVLGDLYWLSQQHEGVDHGHSQATLEAMSAGRVAVDHGLEDLERAGLAEKTSDENWVLTEKGRNQAIRDLANDQQEQRDV
jgi:manganese/zinc/iron transport system permease protein